jgi:predicted TIM-barrel fold metal-dependent hydrolase
MALPTIDIHPHIIADDETKYPRMPLFGVQSDWPRTRPVTIEQLVKVMDEAGVDKAAIVQASTCYGFDNSYVADSMKRYPGRFTGVCSIDMLAADAVEKLRFWHSRNFSGLRIFTGGSTAAFDPSKLEEPASFPVWEAAAALGMPICVQTDVTGLGAVKSLSARFPLAKIIVDHMARPKITDGPPYSAAAPLFALAPCGNVYFKVTPRNFEESKLGKAEPATWFARVVAEFGASRLAWGSNFPASEGGLGQNLKLGRAAVASLSAEDQKMIFGGTAASLYPGLAQS